MADKQTDTSTPEGRALREAGKKWLDRISESEKVEKVWIDDAEVAVAAYTGEGNKGDNQTAGKGIAYDFNIVFSNVETIVPAIINSAPAPDVRRRFGADDPVAKDLAEIIERTIRVQVDDSKLQVEMEAMAQDAFLAGRGVIRLRFRSDVIGSGEVTDDELAEALHKDGKPKENAPDDQTVENERICFEAVSWRDYRHGPAKRWQDRPWEAFRHTILSDELDDFADAALMASQTLSDDDADDSDRDVWEIWDKRTRKVLFVAARDGMILKKVDDPLGLSNFFPTPTPVQAIEVTGRLMPVNPFAIYRKLADELDITTKRIRVLSKQLKVKGWYGVSPTDVQAVLDADDNEFVPIADAEIWAANGGLQNAVLFWPVEKLIVVLSQLYSSREQTKQAIYEITGISDIVRGASKATETLGAQQIKSQWGSLRIQKMQRMIERAARDLFVMMAEIIPAKFSPATLQKITDIQIEPTEQELLPIPAPQPPQDAQPEQLQALQQQHAQAEQTRQAKLQHLTMLKALMSEKVASFYRIDVESDSTVRADLTRQKEEATGFMQAASGYFAAVGPLVQQGALPVDVAVEIFSSFSRMFNLGKAVEDALDQMVEKARSGALNGGGHQPDMAAIEKQVEERVRQHADMIDAQIRQQEAQTKQQIAMGEFDMKRQAAELDIANKRLDLAKSETELQIKEQDLNLKRRQNALAIYGGA